MTIPAMIPAATLILLRAAQHGPEVLMIERGGGMAFAAGAMVFPGGRIDAGDTALAAVTASPGAHPDEAAARIAAIRETIEEVGIAVALTPPPDDGAVRRLRSGLARRLDFAGLLAAEGLAIDPAMLAPFARWLPNSHPTRNFDTLFFIAEAPDDAVALPDGGESVAAVWGTASALLAEADAGRRRMIFPTRRNLERLAALPTIDAIRRHAADHPVRPITPWIEERAGEQWLCIPEDYGYPVTAERAANALRG